MTSNNNDMDYLSDEDISEESPVQSDFASYFIKNSFPPIVSVNEDYFDCNFTKIVLETIYGPNYFFSGVLKYVYKKYPMIKNIKVLEEENLESLQKQIEIQGNSEYSICYQFDSYFIDKVCQSGCFPLGNALERYENILVKLHHTRCVLKNISKNLHVSKTIKKLSKRYMITINCDYYNCVKEINSYHNSSWLFPHITSCFEELYLNNINNGDKYKTKVFSFELWNIHNLPEIPKTITELKKNGKLVAGEIGYTVGTSYTSLTGYHTEKSSGTVQLIGTGKLLEKYGYKIWDFGMSMDYKIKLGAENISRKEFLDIHKVVKHETPDILPNQPLLVSSLLQ